MSTEGEEPIVVVEEPVIIEEVVVEEVLVEEQIEEPVIIEEQKEEPVVIEEQKEEPVVIEEQKEEPVVIEEPVIEEPVIEEPVVIEEQKEEPVIIEEQKEEPVVIEEQKEEPVVIEEQKEEPVIEEPVIEEPVVIEEQKEEVLVEEQKEENITYEQIFEESKQEEYVQEAEQIMEVVKDEPVLEEYVSEEPVQLVDENITYEQIFQESKQDVHEYVQEAEQLIEVIPEEEVEVTESDVQENYDIVVEPIEPKKTVPKLIFIVPYRDREEQRRFFDLQMKKVLEDYDYRIIYAHQTDKRSFNRGAMKNIGFLYAKSIYPNDYQNITFVFNDVDTMPYTKGLLNYDTTLGNVKHFYGYQFTLGGIVSIKGADFEKTKGYPNYWAWGYEDNAFQRRVNKAGLAIDRSNFFPITDKNILQLKDGLTRVVNRGEFDRYVDEVKLNNDSDGIGSLYHISFNYDNSFLNIITFQTPIQYNPSLDKVHDMRDGPVPFKYTAQQRRRQPLMKMAF